MGSRITLELYSVVRLQAGKKKIEYEAETVGQVIEKFLAEYSANFDKSVLSESGCFEDWIQVLLNGKSIKFLDGVKTKLKENDTIAIIPTLGGG